MPVELPLLLLPLPSRALLAPSPLRRISMPTAIASFAKSPVESSDSHADTANLTGAPRIVTDNRVRAASDSLPASVLHAYKSFPQRENDRQRRRDPPSSCCQRHFSDMRRAPDNLVPLVAHQSPRLQQVPQEQGGQPQQQHRSGSPQQHRYDRIALATARDAPSLKQANRTESSGIPKMPLTALLRPGCQQVHLSAFDDDALKMSDLLLAILSHGDRWLILLRLGVCDTLGLSRSSYSTAFNGDNQLPFFFTHRSSNPLFDRKSQVPPLPS